MPDKYPPLFVDRNSGGRTFREILVGAGVDVVLHDEMFPPDTQDEDWVNKVGESGRVAITGDIALTKNLLFLRRLKRSKAQVFILCALNGKSAQGKADCILASLAKIAEVVQNDKGPSLWKIGMNPKRAKKFDFLVKLSRRPSS